MFDVDDSIGRYGDTLPSHLNLKPLPLLDAISKSPQFFGELFYKVILFDVAFMSFLLRCHSQPPLFM